MVKSETLFKVWHRFFWTWSDSGSLSSQEPGTKRSKLVSRVTSLANLLPPVKAAPLKRIGQTLQVSRGDDVRQQVMVGTSAFSDFTTRCYGDKGASWES